MQATTSPLSLRWLYSIQSSAGHLARWSMFWQQYDSDIKYCRGGPNEVADVLSREPLEGQEHTSEDIPTFKSLEKCAWYEKRLEELQRNPEAFPDYSIRNDRLYRHFHDSKNITIITTLLGIIFYIF
ncbi:hypothetical protein JTB14_022202 [Gonioctena quinquepunctata]|nr:hypothetical protein JTB14_022202 [Gonioctena quinquepunctata]